MVNLYVYTCIVIYIFIYASLSQLWKVCAGLGAHTTSLFLQNFTHEPSCCIDHAIQDDYD